MEETIAAAGFFLAVIVGLISFGPIGRAIAAKISRSGSAAPGADVLEQVAAMDERLETLQHQVGELAERQDFTERLVAKVRERAALGNGGAA